MALQFPHRLFRVFLERVGHRDDAGRAVPDRDEHGRLSLCREFFGSGVERPEIDLPFVHEALIPEDDLLAVKHRPDAVAGQGFELVGLFENNALRYRGAHDRLAERMFGPLFRGAGVEQDGPFAQTVPDHVGDLRFYRG